MESEFCMKCGRELKGSQVFCNECLEKMEQYPVKPGVVVLLPNHQGSTPAKTAPRRKHPVISPEEQMLRMKQRIKRLTIALILAVAAAAAAGWLTVSQYLENQEVKLLPGQNYSSEQPQETNTNP